LRAGNAPKFSKKLVLLKAVCRDVSAERIRNPLAGAYAKRRFQN
jgi:hypothetical protein